MLNDLLKMAMIGLALSACSGDKSDTTDSGADTDTDTTADTDTDTTPSCALSCTTYCTTYLGACTADPNNEYADQADCEAQCANFECGAEGDATGNPLGCRLYHAGVAAHASNPDNAATHCPHAGLNPTSECI